MHLNTLVLFVTTLLSAIILAIPTEPAPAAVGVIRALPEKEIVAIPITPRTSEQAAIAEAFEYASAQASCKVLKCVSIITSVACISEAISTDNWVGVLACGAKDKVGCRAMRKGV
ncbi:hypothetical protein BU16DRAFT_557289 [Lophium mytilinum]|uniref:Fungal calcium binding protein domain-containing protein n=1 Tax=Lophium mytilinum TaxID=390894 RepID=A0A6A6R8D5_9PEZI|nr:hypothetical protein BU16DRAFT_557289 [Lophium mytilinum]